MKSSISLYFLNKLVLSSRSGALIRRISILSFLGITVSVAIFFIILFVMNGMNQKIRTRIVAVDPNLTIFNNNDETPKNKFGTFIKERILKNIDFDSYDLIIRTVDGQFRGTQATGYTQDGLNFWHDQLKNLKINEDRKGFYEFEIDLKLDESEVAMGIDLARSLQLLEGDQVTLIPSETLLLSQFEAPQFEKVTLKKILSTDIYDIDSKLLLFNKDNSLFSFRKGLSKLSGEHIWLFSPIEAYGIKKELTAEAQEAGRSAESYRVETWEEKNSDLFFALFMEKTMIGVFLALAGLVASSSILTVLSLLMTQKRTDIALFKTLGLSQANTLVLFVKIGLWISLTAVFVGTLIGLGVSYYLQFYPLQVLPDFYYDSSIPATVDLGFTFLTVISICILAFLGSYIPARMTLRIQPAILLKQKV